MIRLRYQVVFLLITVFIVAVPSLAYIKDMSHAQQDSARADRWERRDSWQNPDEVIAFLSVQPGATVADLGAGFGYFTEKIARAVGPQGRVLALDVQGYILGINERAMAEYGHENVETRLISTEEPGIQPGEADVVFICKTWHLFPERFCYARKIAGIMTEDTRVVVVNSGLEAKTVTTRRAGTTDRYEVQRQAEAAGMKLVKEMTLNRLFLVEFRLGEAAVLEEVGGFRYITSELAIADRELTEEGLVLLRERGFQQILDIDTNSSTDLVSRVEEAGIAYRRIESDALSDELGVPLGEVTLLIAESAAEALEALVKLADHEKLPLNSCEREDLLD